MNGKRLPRSEAKRPSKEAPDGTVYRFAVDLIRKSVQPLDQPTRALMGVGVHPAHSVQGDAG